MGSKVRGAWGRPAFCKMGTSALFPGVEAGRAVNHTLMSGATPLFPPVPA